MLPLVALSLASCEKNNDNKGYEKLIKTISGYSTDFDTNNGLCTSIFEYDTQHRITKVTVSGYNEMYTYEYIGNEIIEKYWYSKSGQGAAFNESEMISDRYTRYILNDDGYLSREESFWGLDEQLGRTCIIYVYDNGLLKKSIEDSSNGFHSEHTYEWYNNNIIRCTHIGQSDMFSTTTYVYGDEDKGNIMGWYSDDSPWLQIHGIPDTYLVFKGMKNKNLITSLTEYDRTGSISYVNSRNFYYQFDADGYVIETALEQNGTVDSYNISYVTWY